MKPWLSQTRWIFVPKPPRDRPSAWSGGSAKRSAAGPANIGGGTTFFFAPAAARLARMTEASTTHRSRSMKPAWSNRKSKASPILAHVPSLRQRLKRS